MKDEEIVGWISGGIWDRMELGLSSWNNLLIGRTHGSALALLPSSSTWHPPPHPSPSNTVFLLSFAGINALFWLWPAYSADSFAHFYLCICQLCFKTNAKMRNGKNTAGQSATFWLKLKLQRRCLPGDQHPWAWSFLTLKLAFCTIHQPGWQNTSSQVPWSTCWWKSGGDPVYKIWEALKY